MIAWHRRYDLGDKHNYDNPREFLAELVRTTVSLNKVIKYVKQGNAKSTKLKYSAKNKKCYI